MSIAQLITHVRNLFGVHSSESSSARRRSLAEISTLSEKEDFDSYLDEAGIPPLSPNDVEDKKWSEGNTFNRAQFDSEAYKQYLEKFADK